ncbi:hemerythrin HHE cation binding domain-containing protein [Actinocorallia herbida]|uniref:Hemerythrin HHE cation binding domain-containing protein n=1 Tax=Actinocorallia herbida TaxID=58109 RepID=A0A3N1CW63_9ACTN|nr:hemerythrin domain-containing protein [Actinocorallia herbida]ROO85465.1 hemerythrin HHE cation binding domain-containing protein [Actinocorallia herbida]
MQAAAPPHLPQITLPGQAAAAPGPLDMGNMYLAHYGFRRDLGRLITAVGRVRPDDRRRVAALREHLGWVLFVLRHHHTAEDEAIWPLLRDRAPEARGTIDALEAEHAACDRWILESTDAFREFEGSPAGEAGERLMTALRGLADALGAHLAHEETEGIPLMMAHIAPAEDAAMHKAISRRFGPGKMITLLGWLTSELPPDVEEHLRRTSPKPMLLLHPLAARRYRRRAAYLWG